MHGIHIFRIHNYFEPIIDIIYIDHRFNLGKSTLLLEKHRICLIVVSTNTCTTVKYRQRNTRKHPMNDFAIKSSRDKESIYIIQFLHAGRIIIINSSASAPLNATKIPVKKGSDVDVCMFRPEL